MLNMLFDGAPGKLNIIKISFLLCSFPVCFLFPFYSHFVSLSLLIIVSSDVLVVMLCIVSSILFLLHGGHDYPLLQSQ